MIPLIVGISLSFFSLAQLAQAALGPYLIYQGGTSATTSVQAFLNLAPTTTGNNGKFLNTDGSSIFWSTVTAGAPTTTINGAQALVFTLRGDGTTVTSSISGTTTTFALINTGNWAGTWQLKNPSDFLSSSTVYIATTTGNWLGTWQGNNSSTFYLVSNPAGYITSSALNLYLTTTTAAATYYPLTNPAGYITSSNGGISTTSINTWTKLNTFNGGVAWTNATGTVANIGILTVTSSANFTGAAISGLSVNSLNNTSSLAYLAKNQTFLGRNIFSATTTLATSTISDLTVSNYISIDNGATDNGDDTKNQIFDAFGGDAFTFKSKKGIDANGGGSINGEDLAFTGGTGGNADGLGNAASEGGGVIFRAGKGGDASSTDAAGNGGVTQIYSGNGGYGSATHVSGNGGSLIFTAGEAGPDLGGGAGLRGDLDFNGRVINLIGDSALNGSLSVVGTSTLATTTMSFGSKIGSATKYMSVSPLDLGGAGSITTFPIINFNSSDFVVGDNVGGFQDRLLLVEKEGNPGLFFISADAFSTGNSGSITFTTSTKQFDIDRPLRLATNLIVDGTSTLTTATIAGKNVCLSDGTNCPSKVSTTTPNTWTAQNIFNGGLVWGSATGTVATIGNLTVTSSINVSGTSTLATTTVNGVPVHGYFTTSTASLGGGLLTAGTCTAADTQTISGITTNMIATCSASGTDPGDGTFCRSWVSSANIVSTKVCAILTLTPTAAVYNLAIFTK